MTMRAKFRVTKVEAIGEHCERVTMSAVTEKPYDAEGASEDNSFARYTPSGELAMSINNPNLRGAMKEGDTFYLDFSRVEAAAVVAPAVVEAPVAVEAPVETNE